ncbi:MAG: hypothetical protein ACREMB_22175 [Candidatus Rokuibacteriota bacterium]
MAGTGENHGPEQEYLNHVFGARLRITTLRAAGGPGIELLEYHVPGPEADAALGFREGVLVRNPDGHVMRLTDGGLGR